MKEKRVRMAALRTGLAATLVAVATTVSAQGLVITPSLRAIFDDHACMAVNQNTTTQNITISVLNDATGAVDCSGSFPTLAAHSSARVPCPGVGGGSDGGGVVRHCVVLTESNTIADNMLVNLTVEDANLTALATVRGLRTITLFNGVTATPRLSAGASTKTAECLFTNTGASAQFTAQFFFPNGVGFGPPTVVTLGQHQGYAIVNSYVPGVWCEVFGQTTNQTKQLRVALTTEDSGTGSGAAIGAP